MVVGGQRHAPAALATGRTRYPLYRRLGGPQDRSGRVRKISPPPRFDPRTAPKKHKICIAAGSVSPRQWEILGTRLQEQVVLKFCRTTAWSKSDKGTEKRENARRMHGQTDVTLRHIHVCPSSVTPWRPRCGVWEDSGGEGGTHFGPKSIYEGFSHNDHRSSSYVLTFHWLDLSHSSSIITHQQMHQTYLLFKLCFNNSH
jgi:hypothetical protein